MNLTYQELLKLNLNALNLEALRATKVNQQSEGYLLLVLEVAEERGLHLDCGVTSLYQYCTRLLHLSESISYALISVVNKGKEVPELKEAVKWGLITLSKAKKICSVITKKNHKEWIELARHETSRVVEKCVAQANPKTLVQESAKYKAENLLEFKLGVDEEFIELLKTVKDLESQKSGKGASSVDALKAAMKEYIQRHHPVEKAKRAEKRRLKGEQFPGTVKTDAKEKISGKSQERQGGIDNDQCKRQPFKKITIHQVNLRDEAQCTHVSKLGRCEEKRWLDIHHIIPVARGGTNKVANLKTLCWKHHRMEHHH